MGTFYKTSRQHSNFCSISKTFRKTSQKFTKVYRMTKYFTKLYKKIQRAIQFFILFSPTRQNEQALNLCEPIHNRFDPETFSTRIIRQLVFSLDTSFTKQNTSSTSFFCTCEINFFRQSFNEIIKSRLKFLWITIFIYISRKLPQIKIFGSHNNTPAYHQDFLRPPSLLKTPLRTMEAYFLEKSFNKFLNFLKSKSFCLFAKP